MLSQHEADTLAEAVVVLGDLQKAAKGDMIGAQRMKRDEAFYLGRFAEACAIMGSGVQDVLKSASIWLDDEKARDVLGAG